MEKLEDHNDPKNKESLTLEEVQRRIDDFRRIPSLTVEQEEEWRELMRLKNDILSKEN